MQRHEQAETAMPDGLLDDHLFKTEVFNTQTTIFLVGPHAQQARFTSLEKNGRIATAILAPLFDIGRHLALHEPPHAVTEHFMIFIKNQTFHGSSSCAAGWRIG
jgi:hypothetical protein